MNKNDIIIWANRIFGIGLILLGLYVPIIDMVLWPFSCILIGIGTWMILDTVDLQSLPNSEGSPT